MAAAGSDRFHVSGRARLAGFIQHLEIHAGRRSCPRTYREDPWQ
jgi:hypothetical protein